MLASLDLVGATLDFYKAHNTMRDVYWTDAFGPLGVAQFGVLYVYFGLSVVASVWAAAHILWNITHFLSFAAAVVVTFFMGVAFGRAWPRLMARINDLLHRQAEADASYQEFADSLDDEGKIEIAKKVNPFSSADERLKLYDEERESIEKTGAGAQAWFNFWMLSFAYSTSMALGIPLGMRLAAGDLTPDQTYWQTLGERHWYTYSAAVLASLHGVLALVWLLV